MASGTSTRTLAFDPDNAIPELDDLDLSFAWSNGETGNQFTVHMFNGELWRNSNGDDPDFFLFEAGTGDGSEIAAILPGGVIGQSVTLSGSWGRTGHNSNGQSIDGNTTGNGQAIVGICWAITDLLDENGNALTNDSIIEGIAVTARNGMDPADWFAVVDRPYQAREPHPEDKATDVIRDIILTWEPGWSASQHIVYFGTDFDDVNNGTDSAKVGPAQDALVYDPPGLLDFGQTYFWRVDEVNTVNPNSPWKGEVWSFEVEPYAYPLAVVDAIASSTLADLHSVNRIVDRSGITVDANGNDVHSAASTDMWKSGFLPAPASAWLQYSFDAAYTLHELLIWNANEFGEEFQGLGIKDISIETSLNGDVWTPLGDFVVEQGPGQPGYAGNEPIDFGDVQAQHVKLVIHSNWGGIIPQFSVSEVEFSYIPVKAREPKPDNGATGVDPDIVLGWRTGRQAVSHTITLSTDPETVIETTDNTYDTTALDLQLGESYSWVVTEVNEAATPSVWEGDVWTFTIVEPLVFDDMESYQDKHLFIWSTWLDGTEFGTNDPDNGSIVGAAPTMNDFRAATGLGRGQSLPIWFDNTTVSYSEAMRFVDNEDWTRHGIESLSLYFRKGVDNTGGDQVYVKINDKQVVYQEPVDMPPGWQTEQWTQWIIDLSSVGTDLTKVMKIMIGVKGANAKGVLYVDDITFYKNTPASEQVVSWFEAESGTLGPTMMLFSDNGGVLGASGGQFIGTEDGTGENTTVVQMNGIATYTFSVAQAGVYKVMMRGGDFGGNSFWVRIPGSVINTNGNADNPGWVACNFVAPDAFRWLPVTDYNDGNQVVEYTLTAGQHTLEIGRREDGAFLDAIAIVSVTK
ncbi:hypothetical protein ACFL5Z_02235 [Planctomycetota bacterium]